MICRYHKAYFVFTLNAAGYGEALEAIGTGLDSRAKIWH